MADNLRRNWPEVDSVADLLEARPLTGTVDRGMDDPVRANKKPRDFQAQHEAGATGLEPATSGVTGLVGAYDYRSRKATNPCNSGTFVE